MSDNKKIVVNTDGSKIEFLEGKAYHVLEDHTQNIFKTTSIKTFSEFIEKSNDYNVFYSPEEIVAMPIDCNRYTLPLAVCTIDNSKALTDIIHLNNLTLSKSMLIIELKKTQRFLDTDGHSLLKELRSFKITSEEIRIYEDDDSGGNVLETKKGSKIISATLPEKISFRMPIFRYHPDEIKIEFIVESTITDSNQIELTLHNFDHVDLINDAEKTIIEEYLSKFDNKFWGKHNIVEMTDLWKYKTK